MTELVGSVKLFTEDQESPTLENVGTVRLFRELVGHVKLAKPFGPAGNYGNPNGGLVGLAKHDRIVITEQNITDKKFFLSRSSLTPNTVIFLPAGGIPQFLGEDFHLEGNVISWDGLGLDGFIEENDIIHVYYN